MPSACTSELWPAGFRCKCPAILRCVTKVLLLFWLGRASVLGWMPCHASPAHEHCSPLAGRMLITFGESARLSMAQSMRRTWKWHPCNQETGERTH